MYSVPESSSQITDGSSGKTSAKYINFSPYGITSWGLVHTHQRGLTTTIQTTSPHQSQTTTAYIPPFRNNRKPPQPSFHRNHPTKWEISKTTTCASQTIPLNIIHPYTKPHCSPQKTSPTNHHHTLQTTHFSVSATTTFTSKTITQCTISTTTSLPPTITTQSTFKFDGEHETIPHHIQYVHE